MNPGNKKVIAVTALISFGIITAAELQRRDSLPTGRQYLGLSVAYLFVSAGADLGLPIAGGFAAMICTTIILTRGDNALKFLEGKTGGRQMALPREGNETGGGGSFTGGGGRGGGGGGGRTW